jgi:uncharacterized protein (UPF0333 family)
MIIPLLALIAAVIAAVYYMIKNAKNPDKGNRPGSTQEQ